MEYSERAEEKVIELESKTVEEYTKWYFSPEGEEYRRIEGIKDVEEKRLAQIKYEERQKEIAEEEYNKCLARSIIKLQCYKRRLERFKVIIYIIVGISIVVWFMNLQ